MASFPGSLLTPITDKCQPTGNPTAASAAETDVEYVKPWSRGDALKVKSILIKIEIQHSSWRLRIQTNVTSRIRSPPVSLSRHQAECTQAEQNIWFGRIIHAFFLISPFLVTLSPVPRRTTCSITKTMRWLLHVIARYFRYSRPSSSISRLLHSSNSGKTLVYSGPACQKHCNTRRVHLAAVSVVISKLLPAPSSDKIGSTTF